MNLDGVADHGSNQRPEHAQVLPVGAALLDYVEVAVGVLAIQRFGVAVANSIDPVALDEHIRLLVERLTGNAVETERGVVPNSLFSGNEVNARRADGLIQLSDTLVSVAAASHVRERRRAQQYAAEQFASGRAQWRSVR